MPDERICAREGCGRPVRRRRPHAIFCSPNCATRAGNDKRKGPELPTQPCAFCGTKFVPVKKAHYCCSLICQQELAAQKRREASNGDELFDRREVPALHHVEDVEEGEFAIYWADSHVPFADWPLMGAISKVIADFQPRREFIGGDAQDVFDLSKFDKNPTRRHNLSDEGSQVVAILDYRKSLAPGMEQYWEDGNHEDRFRHWLWRNAGSLYEIRDVDTGKPVLSIPALLKLAERGVHYYPFPSRLDYQGFIITHGPKRGGGGKHCAKWMSEYVRSSGVCFHFHRNQDYGWAGDDGQAQTFYAVGCTCTLQPEWLPFPDWQQGFGYSRVVNGKVHFTPVHIFDRTFIVEGQVYKY